MRICLDYQPAVTQRAGVGRYTRVLAAELARRLSPEDHLRLFYFDFRRRAEPPAFPGVRPRPFRALPGALLQQSWKRWHWPDYRRLAGAADLYHFTNFIIPPLSRKSTAVVTLFDMSFERFPQFAEARNLRYLRSEIGRTLRRADAILTISRFSAGEIETLRPEAAGKVFVAPLGIDPSFRRVPEEAIAALRKRRGLSRPYLLCVGTLEPRKNYPLLIEAFDRLEAFDGDLVIAGMPGWRCAPIFESMRRARRADRIRYLEYVAEGDLPALYSGAELFVLPSFYEGFGFPPLEAMACGVPVVSSRGGSLPEVLGDAAVIVPGFALDDWVDTLRSLLDDAGRRRSLAEAGPRRAARYRWEETARQTLECYRKAVR